MEEKVDVPDRVGEITVSPLEAFPGGTIHVTGTCTLWGFAATRVYLFIKNSDTSIPFTGVMVPIDPNTGLIDADVVLPLETHPGQSSLGWMCVADDMAFAAEKERIPFLVLGTPSTNPATPPAGQTGSGGSVDVATSPESADTLAATGFADSTVAVIGVAGIAATGAAAVCLSFVSRRRRARLRP